MATAASRSTLVNHSYPSFYACYLLKSIQTPLATATYIGSTPNPARRIRQHNGELTAGAAKTKHSRPWVMHLIVHGFPSKLAALQFEWAWQHPLRSRHAKDEEGRQLFTGHKKNFRKHVKVLRTMVSTRPYSLWPLHVKLFTAEAEAAWNDTKNRLPGPSLPQGFTCASQLDGMQTGLANVKKGKGKATKNSLYDLDIKDEQFTSEHLSKQASLLSPCATSTCSICHESVDLFSEPLTSALCPTPGCTSVSHLKCLASSFMPASTPSSSSVIPRGGTCTDCGEYVLWGDVIKGCYRRRAGGAVVVDDEVEESHSEDDEAEEVEEAVEVAKRKSGSKSKSSKRSRKRVATATNEEAEGEFFDLSAVSSTDEDDEALPVTQPRRRGHPKKKASEAVPHKPKANRATQAKMAKADESAGGILDLQDVSDTDGQGGVISKKGKGKTKATAGNASTKDRTKFAAGAEVMGDPGTGSDKVKASKRKPKSNAATGRKEKTGIASGSGQKSLLNTQAQASNPFDEADDHLFDTTEVRAKMRKGLRRKEGEVDFFDEECLDLPGEVGARWCSRSSAVFACSERGDY